MTKNCQLKLNISFLILLLLFQAIYSMKSSLPQKLTSENIIPDFQKKINKKQISFLNLLQTSIKSVQPNQQSIQNTQENQSIQTDPAEDVENFYGEYQKVMNGIQKDYDEKFAFCTKKLEETNKKCSDKIDSIKHELAYHSVSGDLYNRSRNILQSYYDDYLLMNNNTDKLNEAINELEYSTFENLLESASYVYSAYQNIEDKYNITTDNTFLDILDEGKKNQKAKQTQQDIEIDKLINENIPAFTKNEKFSELISKLNSNSEYMLNREAFGQMLFDKLSWYLDYNTKIEEDVLQEKQMLKVRLEEIELAIKKEELNLQKMMAQRESDSSKQREEESKINKDYTSCKGVLELQTKCGEAKKIFDTMTASATLDYEYYDKINEIIKLRYD